MTGPKAFPAQMVLPHLRYPVGCSWSPREALQTVAVTIARSGPAQSVRRLAVVRRGSARRAAAAADAAGRRALAVEVAVGRQAVGAQAVRGRFQGWHCHGVRGALAAFQAFDLPERRPRPLGTREGLLRGT